MRWLPGRAQTWSATGDSRAVGMTYLFKDKIILRNPRKVGFIGSRKGLQSKVRSTRAVRLIELTEMRCPGRKRHPRTSAAKTNLKPPTLNRTWTSEICRIITFYSFYRWWAISLPTVGGYRKPCQQTTLGLRVVRGPRRSATRTTPETNPK